MTGEGFAAYSLIVCIVPHNSAELVTKAANAAGAGGGTVLMGRSSADSDILHALGLGDTSKEIAYIVVPSAQKEKIINAIVAAAETKRKRFGILFSIDTTHFMRHDGILGGEDYMARTVDYQMITVIANKGYADDVMAAARKAGAGGGTVINARGTAQPGDEKFLGMEIVPEKEMVLIIIKSEIARAVLDALRNLPCLSAPGSGIAFSNPVDDFTSLGKKE